MENNLSLKSVKIIALDFDGVITDLNIDWSSAIRLASEIAGYELNSLLAFYEASHSTPVFYSVSRRVEELELDALKNAKPTPFIAEFLNEISKKVQEIYIVSMQSTVVVEKFLKQNNLAQYFREILTREKFPSKKAQINYLVHKANISPNQILLVDDLKKNITECRKLGIQCFYFRKSRNPRVIRRAWKFILEMT